MSRKNIDLIIHDKKLTSLYPNYLLHYIQTTDFTTSKLLTSLYPNYLLHHIKTIIQVSFNSCTYLQVLEHHVSHRSSVRLQGNYQSFSDLFIFSSLSRSTLRTIATRCTIWLNSYILLIVKVVRIPSINWLRMNSV